MTKLLSRYYTRGFHKLFYYSFFGKESLNIYWMGVPTAKCPLDMWVYQEIIYETKPEVIIETGTFYGGSALFFASIFDLMKRGQVITIDIANNCKAYHPRITKIIGNSISDEVINQVKEIVGNKTAMVVLDSDHSKDHVLKEMELYSEFVSVGNYLVVEDTNINGHPVLLGWGEGPMEAVEEFLRRRDDFVIDRSREKFLLTFYPKGFLKRVNQNKRT
ncbi:MAG: class I SAM-dependent methyltransferase [Candidatus Marinimicrobia bacterium]|nr:class I SAM-dependent methyltransferase [Candidatus Neomarinimicrobiota bacterium]